MTAKGISIEMPVGADAPLLADNTTPNPFFGYINQSCNRRGFRGVELIGGKMWLRQITDVGDRGFTLPLMLQVVSASTALFGEAVEVYNYPTVLKVADANKNDLLPEYFDIADVVETLAVIDEETGEETTPAVMRRPRYSELHGAKEDGGFLYCMNSNGRNYSKGSVCVQLAAETGVEVVALSDYPVSEPEE